MLGAFFQIKAHQAPFLSKFARKELNKNMTSKKASALILGAILVKSKYIQQCYEGFHKFPQILPGFSSRQTFWGCSCTPASYTSAKHDLQHSFGSQYCSWARSHHNHHYDGAFYVYTLLMYTNTQSKPSSDFALRHRLAM